jgi:hypothetical protein
VQWNANNTIGILLNIFKTGLGEKKAGELFIFVGDLSYLFQLTQFFLAQGLF